MAKPTRRRSREQEMRELLALREAEGLTMRELAAACGVPAGTLSWWAAEVRRRDRAAGEEPKFVELVVGGDEHMAQVCEERGSFEVTLRCGTRVLVPVGYGLVRLLRDLAAC